MADPEEEFIRNVVNAIEACEVDKDVDQAPQIRKIASMMKLHARDPMFLVFMLTWIRAGMVMTTLKAVNASATTLKQAAQKNLEASDRLQVQSFARRFAGLLITAGMALSAMAGAYFTSAASFRVGYAEGLQSTHLLRDVLASPDGPAVAGLIAGGELSSLANCDKPGWTKRGEHCVPFSVIRSDGVPHVVGWRIRR